MKILDRYIFREALTFFVISLISFVGILLVVRILKFTHLIVNKGVALGQIAMVFLSIIPTFLEIALPMATLLGVLLAFARLSGDSEIVVIRASGVSLLRLIRPVLWFGVLAMALSFFISIQLRPWGYRKFSESLFEIARTRSTSGLSEGVFNELGKLILYADQIDHATGDLRRVIIDDRRDPLLRKIISARFGLILSDPDAQKIAIHLKQGQIHEQVGDNYSLTDFTINSIALDPNDLYNADALKKEPKFRELSLRQLADEQDRLEQQPLVSDKTEEPAPSPEELQSKIAKIQIEAGRRFSMPVAALLLALIAFPLGIHPPRTQKTWGAGLSVLLAAAVFMIYYAMLSFGMALGETGVLPPLVGLWLPNLILAGVGIILIRRIGSERWHSVIHGIEGLLALISLRVQRRLEA